MTVSPADHRALADVVALLDEHGIDVKDTTHVTGAINDDLVQAELCIVAPTDGALETEGVETDESGDSLSPAEFEAELDEAADKGLDGEPEDSGDAEQIDDGVSDGRSDEPQSDTPEQPREYGTYTTASYGLPLSGDVAHHFDTDRVTVVERDYGADLVPGALDEGRDYAVDESRIQLSSAGARIIGASDGDDVRVVPDGDGVRLELLDSDDDGETSGTGWEIECDECGQAFDSQTELSDHQKSSKCGAKLPEDVSTDEFEEIVADAETVFEVTQELRTLYRPQVKALLDEHDLTDEVASTRSPEQMAALVDDDDGDAPTGDDTWKQYSKRAAGGTDE